MSLKRLGYVMMVIFAVCAVFLSYGLRENSYDSVPVSTQPPADQPLIQGALPQQKDPLSFYVIGSPGDSVPGRIYGNVCTLMEDLHLSWQGASTIRMENLKPDRSLVIFCGDTLSSMADPEQFEAYVSRGGRVILAAGLAEKGMDTYLQPVLGIVEKTIRVTPRKLHFLKPFLPVQEEFMGYEDHNVSFWLRLQNEACIYLEDADNQAPVIYSFPYQQGQVLVFNSTLLCDGRCMGLLTSGIGTLLDTFLYPVLGAEVICLDNFPLVLTADDRDSMSLYGRAADAFVRDILWPTFQGMALRSGIPYTAAVTTASTRDTMFQEINNSLFHSMGKSIFQFDMELAHGVYHEGKGQLSLHSAFLQEMQTSFPDYSFTSLAALTDHGVPEAIGALGGGITAVRGDLLSPDPAMRFSLQEDYTVFPCATRGTDLERTGMLTIASVYASHGMISHTFDIQDFLGGTDGVPVWDTEKIRLEEFEKRVLGEFQGLTPLTLRETGSPVRSYVSLRYAWDLKAGALHLYADQFVSGQPFLLRTDRELLRAQGADFLAVGENYYLIRQQEPESTLYLSEGKPE